MDYEKKYKEALERAKKFEEKYGGGYAGYIFPELKESEDERMLEKIISYLEMIKMGCVICTIDTSEEIAWLEKQKEQKPAEWSEDDEAIRIEVIKLLSNPSLYEACEHLREESVDWLKTLHTKVNVNSEKVSANSEKVNVNWSEEDIKKIRSEEYTKGFNDAAFGGKLKEWSVEDEDKIRQIERIAQQAGCTQKLQEEIHDWLKSLRPSWKPSEEQIRLLQHLSKRIDVVSHEVDDMSDDLKKLM